MPGYGNGIAPGLIFSHPSSLRHDTGFGHPERADRIRAVEAELESRDWLGWERRESPAATEEQLLAVHPESHIEAVRALSDRGGAFDLDTPCGPGSCEAAEHAAGGACALVEALLGGEAACGFSIARPPGHHAERARAMGFCLFANAAIAARHALGSLGAERVLILDWDVHHGNGTNAIFHSSREVLFASIHQWPFYPGTGPLDDAGSGEGEGFSINLPVPARTGEETFLGLVEHVVAPAARQYRPDLVLLSAGFDAHRDDPVGGCALETSSYGELGIQARALADELGAPVGAVLEGGYDLDALAASVAATMEGLAGDGAAPSLPADAVVSQAAQQVGRYWRL
ncbi:MAG TPA: histone deacetylase [Thermoleophilaceae bacterium]|nr:histone deacetylase [Thermoleophilaceae bacterium]